MSPNSPHLPFLCRSFLQSLSRCDVIRIEVLNVVETRVSHYHMDIQIIVHHIGEGEEVFGVEENLVSECFEGMACGLALFAACVQGGGCRNDFD